MFLILNMQFTESKMCSQRIETLSAMTAHFRHPTLSATFGG